MFDGILGKLFGNKNKSHSCYTERLLEIVDLPHTVFSLDGNRQKIINCYMQKLKEGEENGFIPVIIKVSRVLVELMENRDNNYSIEELLDVDCLNGKAELDKLWESEADSYDDKFDINEVIGNGEKGEVITSSLLDKIFEKYTNDVVMFEVPVTEPWKVFAWFPVGGWNGCPDTKIIMAAAKYWYDKYGAIPMMISGAEIDFYVQNKVPTEQALNLAKEHFALCPDRVYQCTGSGTISEIADSLTKSNIWYFWWD